jgi:hypothetical protein
MNENVTTIDVVQTPQGYRAIYPEAKLTAKPKTDNSPTPTQAPIPPEIHSGYQWAPWGAGDCLPNDIQQKILSTPIAGEAVRRMMGMMYGNGLAYYRNQDLFSGDTKIKRFHYRGIEEWLKRNKLKTRWVIPQILDYRFFMNTFSDVIFNRRKDFITGLYHKSAPFCRLSKMDEKDLHIKHLIYSPYFGQGHPPSSNKRVAVPLLRWYDEENFLKKLSGRKFAYHSKMETPGSIYYATMFWIGLFQKDGWVDVNKAVPKVISAMMNNQVRLKYQILIPDTYFQIRHQNEWSGMDDKARQKIMDDLVDKINKDLSGTENAYVSITTFFREDPVSKEQSGIIKIIAIDDKVKSDSWVPSAEHSNAQIAMGLGMHPSQMGIGKSGGPLSAGSGSDQRESFNTGINLNTIEQEIILEPLNWIAQFNAKTDPNWDVTFFFDHTYHTTTNNQESGMQASQTTLEVQ